MLGIESLNLEQWILGYHFGSVCYPPLLEFHLHLSCTQNGPSTDEVLFHKDLSLTAVLQPKMASKSTSEVLSFGLKEKEHEKGSEKQSPMC